MKSSSQINERIGELRFKLKVYQNIQNITEGKKSDENIHHKAIVDSLDAMSELRALLWVLVT